MKKLILTLLLVSLSQADYYDLGNGMKVAEFTPKGDSKKLCVAVKLYGDSISIFCFDKKDK